MAFQGDSIYWVEVEKVVPNPFQPRREFDQNKLQELADSIRMYGVLQPLTVTRNEVQREDGTFYTEYELIAGERRLRASKLAGTAQVPVIIREGEQSEQEKLELAIIENLQREDLNAVDRALAFKQLAEMFGLSHAQVAEKVGRSREYVSNSIRLLGLPENILEALKYGKMSEGHARTLLMLNDRPEEQDVIFREILLKKMSVREVERIVRKIATDKVRKKSPGDLDSYLIEYEKQFTETLGTRVQIQKTDFGGKLTIDYFSVEDLEGMLERMKKEVAEMLPEQDPLAKLSEHTPLEHSASESPTPATPAEPPVPTAVSPESDPVTPEPSPVSDQELPSEVTSPAQALPIYPPTPNPQDPYKSYGQPQSPDPDPVVPEPSVTAEQNQVLENDSLSPELPELVQTEEQQPADESAELPVAQSQNTEKKTEAQPNAPHVHHQPFAARYTPPSFQNHQPPAPDVPVVAKSAPAVEAAPIVQPESPAPVPQPASEKPALSEDDSDLYSMRNFNV